MYIHIESKLERYKIKRKERKNKINTAQANKINYE